jgi:hypothetical protein
MKQSGQPGRLVCIGEGPLRESLQAQRSEAGLEEDIELTGLILRERMFERPLAADLTGEAG